MTEQKKDKIESLKYRLKQSKASGEEARRQRDAANKQRCETKRQLRKAQELIGTLERKIALQREEIEDLKDSVGRLDRIRTLNNATIATQGETIENLQDQLAPYIAKDDAHITGEET